MQQRKSELVMNRVHCKTVDKSLLHVVHIIHPQVKARSQKLYL